MEKQKRKARSVRGWTSPTPAAVARAAAAKAEAERKQAKEARRQANMAQHEEWLYVQAKQLPPEQHMDWLSQHAASPSLVTKTMDRLAAG